VKSSHHLVFLFLCAFGVNGADAADYYVRPGGSDANSGTSAAAAWRTVARVNAAALRDGDRVLLEGGATFVGNVVFDTSDGGTAAAPLTLSSYGGRKATIIVPAGTGILSYNRAAVRIAHVKLTGRMAPGSSGIVFYTDMPAAAPHASVTIEDTDVSGFAQDGVQIGAWNGAPGFADVRIVRTASHDNGRTGILTFADRINVHRRVYVGYSKAFNNRGIAGQPTNSGSGIVLGAVDGGTVERSVAHDNGALCTAGEGPVGIWAYDSTRVVIQHNESYRNRTGGPADGGGFDFDQNVTDSVMQFNYSHDNDGAGYLLAHAYATDGHRRNTIRYNISQNDGRKNGYGGIELWGRIVDATVHNNTIFTSYSNAGARAIHLRNSGIELHDPERVRFRNNIVQTGGGAQVVRATAAVLDRAIDIRFENNLYWSGSAALALRWRGVTYTSLAGWQSASGQEIHGGVRVGIVADPQLAAPGRGATYDDALLIHDVWQYRVRATSPAIDAGFDLSAVGIARGPRDYFGAPSALNRPDIGAHEYHGDCNWTIAPANIAVLPRGGASLVSVGMSAVWGCGWAATSSQPWVTVSAASGGVSGSFTVSVARNDGPARSAFIRIANRAVVVSQEAAVAPLPFVYHPRPLFGRVQARRLRAGIRPVPGHLQHQPLSLVQAGVVLLPVRRWRSALPPKS
jgi:hypothetical protein